MKLVLVVLIILAAPALAAAEEPTGFAQIAWGTPSFKVHDALNGQRCRFMRYSETLAECFDYELPSVGNVKLYFDSIPVDGGKIYEGRLAGYTIMLGSSSYSAMLAASVAKFGRPTSQQTASYTTAAGGTISGETVAWQWASASALLTQRCGKTTQSCLMVETKELAALKAQRAAAERAKAKKAF